ncbi:hypothetical protein Dimus_017552 [Dionaea muscipula]
MMMDQQSPEYAPVMPHGDLSRPSLGFPLGAALLIVVIFTLSGIFSCCYHWDRLRSLRQHSSRTTESRSDDLEASPAAGSASRSNTILKGEKMPAVLMPGDHVPKFIAVPCPCNPPRPEAEKYHATHEQALKPPKPPPYPVPLY